MSCDVLFIVHDLYQEDNQFPLNIAYLASILENNGYTVETYCMDVYHYTNKELAKKLDNNEYKIIGLSFMAARFNETVRELCKVINKHKKDAWLVLGGHGPSPIPDYMLKTTKCDAVVVGEGEYAILDLMKDKSKNINKHIYQNMPIKHIDDVPFPAWHLFPMDKYIGVMHWNNGVSMQLISSRGCINRCTFCYRLEKGLRLRSIDNLMEEMMYLNSKYGVDTFQFQDELFLISEKRIDKFNKALKDNGLEIGYTANARVDILNERVATKIKDGGCLLLNVGFESSSQEVLDYMKKNVKVEENMNALKVLKKVGLPAGLNFIWGYPPDNKDTLFENARLIKKHNLYKQCRTIRPVTAYPGCELYYEAIDKKLIDGPEDFFNKFKNSDLMTINHTNYPTELCYKWLLEVNTDLIHDHYLHTTGNPHDGDYLIKQFDDLYSGRITKFRGSRHYNKDEE